MSKLDYTPIVKETPLERLARSYEMQTLYNHKILPFRNIPPHREGTLSCRF